MSQIGRLLQGGILGGAQAYEDAARLHLAQEQARRDAQFDPVRMQNLQAELEDRRSRAERMRRGEAATKQVFEFMRAQRGRNQPGMVGPPAPAVDPFVALPVETLNDADPRVLETVMGDFDNEAAATRNVDEVRNRIAGAQQQGLVDFLPKEVWEPGLQMGLIRPQELAKNASFQRENGDKEADKRQALIDLLATRRQADGSLAFDAMSATRFAGMSLPQLEMQAKIMEANEKAAAARAEQEQQQRALTAQAQQLGIDPGLAGIMTGAQLGEIAQRRAMPAASGSNSARNNGIAESIEARARALESQLIKSPSPELESQVQMLRAAETAARAGDVLPDGGVVLFGGQDVGGGFARVMQPNGQIISVDARLVQQSMGAAGAGAATAQPSPDLDAAAISAFTQRFGVPPDPSNPQHVDAFAEIEAQLQSPR
jgi:hypothetical protein